MANIERGGITMHVGQTVSMAVAGKDDEGVVHGVPGNSYTWLTSDATVLTITSGADAWTKVGTAIDAGTIMVLVTAPDGNTESCVIRVKDAPVAGLTGLQLGVPE